MLHHSTFCCCNKQYVSSWLMKDLLMVRRWKSGRGMLVVRVVPMLKTYCAQWWLNVVFMNSEGVKNPGAAMTSSLYQQNLQSTWKNLAQSYFVGKNFDATSVTLNKYRYDKKERTQPVVTVRTPYSIVIRGIREAMLVVQTYSSTVCTKKWVQFLSTNGIIPIVTRRERRKYW